MSAREEVRTAVEGLLARRGRSAPVADGELLVTSGLLDSTDVLELVVLLEERFGVDFAARPFDPSDFDSIEGIVALCG